MRLTYSLRTLLVVALVTSLLFGLAAHRQRTKQQQAHQRQSFEKVYAQVEDALRGLDQRLSAEFSVNYSTSSQGGSASLGPVDLAFEQHFHRSVAGEPAQTIDVRIFSTVNKNYPEKHIVTLQHLDTGASSTVADWIATEMGDVSHAIFVRKQVSEVMGP